MISVMIVDKRAMVRDELKNLIELDENIQVIAEARDGEECINKLSAVNPDVLLFDINMLETKGIEVLELIRKRKKRPKILILAVNNEMECLINAIDMEIEDYILNDTDSQKLVKAIKYVYNCDKFVRSNRNSLLNSKIIMNSIHFDKIKLLSKREIELLRLIVPGFTNKEISKKLCISECTVKNHLSNIFKKIECGGRTQAAIFCVRSKLVDINEN